MLGLAKKPAPAPIPAGTTLAQDVANAVARLREDRPLLDSERDVIAGLLRGGSPISQRDRTTLTDAFTGYNTRQYEAAAAEDALRPPAPPPKPRQQVDEENSEERRRLWRQEDHAFRALSALAEKLGRSSNGALVRAIADALAVDPAKLLEAEPPAHYRPELLPEDIRRKNGLW